MTKIYTTLVAAGFLLSAAPRCAMAQDDPAGTFQQASAAQTAPAVEQAPELPKTFTNPSLGSTFSAVGGDLKHMFSRENATVLTIFGAAAVAGSHWDHQAVNEMRETPAGFLKAGAPTGALWTQLGVSVGTFAVGKITGNAKISTVGSHLIRAQIASQIVVQGLKFATERSRPDDSNNYSFPSGHSASAFATATVLQRDLGWKVGIPAYAVASYVAASRMGANKHYLSDVLAGAAIGITAGRSVTVGSGGKKFELGLAPTAGGAAVMFTKKN